jgi:hypothetical protein
MTNEAKCQSVDEIVSYPTTRAILFWFVLVDGSKKSITIDMLRVGAKRYAELEASALWAMASAGHEIASFSHTLIK